MRPDHDIDPAGPPVHLLSIATALPPHVMKQTEVVSQAAQILGPRFAQFDRLATAFRNAGIDKRHSVVPMDWFTTPHGWMDRSEAYVAGASDLFCQAAEAALQRADLSADQVDIVVTVSSTGVTTPTLEARVAGRLGFRSDIMRVPVFGLGCAGGVSGLAIARDLATSRPGAVVLMVAVETCTLLFRMDRLKKADIIATALFGDGAAAAVLRAGDAGASSLPRLGVGHQHMWPDTLDIMGWAVEETGLGVIFDRAIPGFAEAELGSALTSALGPVDQRGIDRYVCHPGGAKVIEALESVLPISTGDLDAERAVLREAGNMSAPTALFVLEKVLTEGRYRRMMVMALGPGFTLSLLPVELC